MLRSLKDLERYAVSATDGDIGSVVNFLLDDERWTVRYLVVDTNGFLGGRRVLISPISFRRADWTTRRFDLALTKEKVKNSPDVDVDKPVSRQHEWAHHYYYGYSHYWVGSGLWGMAAYPGSLSSDRRNEVPFEHSDKDTGDIHLRSVKEVRGYHLEGTDEAIGHVEDFIVDAETWEVRYLVIDTSNWWFGKKVLVAPQWITRISWVDRKVHVDMSRQQIKSSPEWKTTAAINREYEARLYDYYGRPAYWNSGDRTLAVPPPHPPESHLE